jgi:hypothetical protein
MMFKLHLFWVVVVAAAVDASQSCGAPPNNQCEDAIGPLTLDGTPTEGATSCASADTQSPYCDRSIRAKSIWYYVVGNGSTIQATTCDSVYTYDTAITIFSGSCINSDNGLSDLVCIAYNDDDYTCQHGFQSLVTWNSQIGVTYYILVHGYSTNSGDFTLRVGPSNVPSTSPLNAPSTAPSSAPSAVPSVSPSDFPSASPSFESMSHEVCENYAVHARTTVTFDGAPTTIHHGDVSVSPGTSITGAFYFIDGGEIVPDSADFAASVLVAHGDAMADHGGAEVTMEIEIGGLTFTPGTYRSDSAINFAHGTVVTLDGGGKPNPEFLFIAGSTLVTAADTYFNLINGAKAENVLWALGTAATLGASSVVEGSIMAGTAITFGTNSELHGCALAQSAVTFESEGSVVLNHYEADGIFNAISV